jgi:hypothetical protein
VEPVGHQGKDELRAGSSHHPPGALLGARGGQTGQQTADLQAQFHLHWQAKWGSTRSTAAELRQKKVYESDHKAHEDYLLLLADLKVVSPSLTASQLHPKIEKKLWQNLKAQPTPYLAKATTATTEEVFNYLRDPRVLQAVLTRAKARQPRVARQRTTVCAGAASHGSAHPVRT